MKKWLIIFVLLLNSITFADASSEAETFFAKGDYLSGMNILTKAINTTDPNQRAAALYTYAKFYENKVGNYNYALMLYNDVLKINHPLKLTAQKDISGLRLLKSLYGSEDLLLKRLRPAENLKSQELTHQINQLQSIIDKKPEYYRIAEVYYYLGRCLISNGDYHQAYILLSKSLELKPAINFFLPVNVYIEQSHSNWIRDRAKIYSKNVLTGILIIMAVVFYISRPWRWFTVRHLYLLLALFLGWIIVFVIFYIFFGRTAKINDNIMATVSAPAPFFIGIEPGNPHWLIPRNLFLYGFIGVIALFVFAVGTSRLRFRIFSAILNLIFAIVLFASLLTIFYLRNCDQKSIYYSENSNYVQGKNYFVTVAMEPYILTNPKKYPNLAVENVADTHLNQWIKTHCPFTNNIKK